MIGQLTLEMSYLSAKLLSMALDNNGTGKQQTIKKFRKLFFELILLSSVYDIDPSMRSQISKYRKTKPVFTDKYIIYTIDLFERLQRSLIDNRVIDK